MSSSEKQHFKSSCAQINAGVTDEQLLQLRSAFAQANTGALSDTSFESSAALSEVASSAMSLPSNRPADLDADNFFAFYASAGDTSEEQRPNLVDAVIEQLRQARLNRQPPH